MVLKLLAAALAILPAFSYGQDLGVPLSWRVRFISCSLEVRLAQKQRSTEIQ